MSTEKQIVMLEVANELIEKVHSELCRKCNCPICGKEFTVSGNAQKYCSIECRQKAHKYKPKSERKFTCNWCGIEFMNIRKVKYCSDHCRLLANGRSTERKKRVNNSGPAIAEIERLCRNEGISYGQYCAKYGLK